MERLSVQQHGSGSPILWIHGFPLSAEVFGPQMKIEGFRHIVPDLSGFGTSPPPAAEVTMATYARDLIAVLDDLGVRAACVAGLSMGGYIAMQLLRDAPERVTSLILLDTRETPDTPETREGRFKSADEVLRSGTSSVVDSMLPKMTARAELQPEVRRIMESASPAGVAAALRAMANRPDSTETLRNASVPCLIVVGEKDAVTPPADAQRMASLVKNSSVVVVPDASHLANLDQPEKVNDAIRSWLTR